MSNLESQQHKLSLMTRVYCRTCERHCCPVVPGTLVRFLDDICLYYTTIQKLVELDEWLCEPKIIPKAWHEVNFLVLGEVYDKRKQSHIVKCISSDGTVFHASCKNIIVTES